MVLARSRETFLMKLISDVDILAVHPVFEHVIRNFFESGANIVDARREEVQSDVMLDTLFKFHAIDSLSVVIRFSLVERRSSSPSVGTDGDFQLLGVETDRKFISSRNSSLRIDGIVDKPAELL